MKNIILAAIKLYQKFISPLLGRHCRFYPSCSVYIARVVEKYGTWRGFWLILKRMLKCHPFNKGGVDLP